MNRRLFSFENKLVSRSSVVKKIPKIKPRLVFFRHYSLAFSNSIIRV